MRNGGNEEPSSRLVFLFLEIVIESPVQSVYSECKTHAKTNCKNMSENEHAKI